MCIYNVCMLYTYINYINYAVFHYDSCNSLQRFRTNRSPYYPLNCSYFAIYFFFQTFEFTKLQQKSWNKSLPLSATRGKSIGRRPTSPRCRRWATRAAAPPRGGDTWRRICRRWKWSRVPRRRRVAGLWVFALVFFFFNYFFLGLVLLMVFGFLVLGGW